MRIAVIGNGMVSYKFCEKLIAKAQSQFESIVFGEENRPVYDRVHLSEFFSNKTADDLFMAPKEWYAKNNILLHLGDLVVKIDRSLKTIHSHHGITESYDYLVIPTGLSAFVPPIPGVEKEGVFIYRTIEDVEMMPRYAKKAKKAAVIVGGLPDLEAAKAMLDLGITNTHIIEFAPRLMAGQIDHACADILMAKLENLGLFIHILN